MKILNGQEAFTALMAGKNIMCRAVGGLIDFDDLNQFPATVFAMPGYEFSIKIDLIELADITFTKPLTLDEYQNGQDVFVICTYGPSIYVVDFKTSALIESINSGFVQRDAENAKLQLKAMCKAFGREIGGDCLIVRLGDEQTKPEKKRQSRKKSDSEPVQTESVKPIGTESTDKQWGDIETPTETTSDDVENKTSDESKVWKTSAQETHELLAQTREMAEAIMTETTHGPVLNSFALEVEQEIAAEEAIKHQEHLSEILNDVALANNPIEVNALVRYTKSWTPEQRQPVITAINKRLVELTAINPVEVSQTPSLMVRIQNASTQHELNELLPEVRSRHPDIQPKLMDCVKKRRFELENQVVTS